MLGLKFGLIDKYFHPTLYNGCYYLSIHIEIEVNPYYSLTTDDITTIKQSTTNVCAYFMRRAGNGVLQVYFE